MRSEAVPDAPSSYLLEAVLPMFFFGFRGIFSKKSKNFSLFFETGQIMSTCLRYSNSKEKRHFKNRTSRLS